MSSLEETGNIVLPNKEEVGFTHVVPLSNEPKKSPTYGETLKANFRQFNDVYRGASWLADKTKNPYREEYDEDYNPIESGLLEQVPDEYHSNIIETKTYEEGLQVVKNIHQELEDRDVRERSGWFANLTTTLGASFFSPTTLIPVTQTVKYASVAKGAFQSASYSAKVLAPTFALQNALLVGTKETEGVKEWVSDTILDTFIATSVGGLLGAFVSKGAESELKTAKAFFKSAEEDIDIRYKMNEKGEIDGMVAVPQNPGVKEEVVKTVQELLDTGNATFKNNAFVRTVLKPVQPIIGMLLSKYGVVRGFGDSMFSHLYPVSNGSLKTIRDPSAENFTRLWNATYSNLCLMTKQHWLEHIGYKGAGKVINAKIGEIKGKWMSYEQFSEEVGISIRRGAQGPVSAANDAAKKWIDEQYNPLWNELKKRRPDLKDHDYTNLANYLNRVYHKGKIQEKPDMFVNDLISFMDRGNKTIEALSSPIKSLEDELKELKSILKKNKNKKGIIVSGEESDLERLIKEKEGNIKYQQDKIQEWIKEGKIGLELLDKLDRTKLRKVLTPEQTKDRATLIRDTILNENEEQMVGRIFDDITGSGESVLKERTVLWNDNEAEKWLVNDINVLGGLYMDQLSKRIHSDDVFLKYGIDAREGMKGMVKLLKQEHDTFREKILEKPHSEERTKQLKKLDKEFKRDQELMENSYKVFMGNYVDQNTKQSRISNGIKQFTAATLLGNMPILQLTEFFTPMFRFMFSEYIQEGLIPTLSRCKHILSQRLKEWGGENVDYIRGSFADAGLGMNMANGARMQSLFGYGTQYQPKTVLERYVNNLSNASQQVSLANMVSDFQETAVAFTSQAKTIRSLKRYLKGETLTKEEIARFDVLRLNPEKWGKKIIEQYEKHGEDVEGSFIANFHKWDEDAFDASQIMRIATEKDVRSVITKPNLLDIPFGMRDPLTSLLTQFLSWNFAATLNFGIPLMKNPDKQKFIGILLMMSSGALIDPLRQLAKGEEVNMSPEALSASAMGNSGVFGWPYDALNKLNSAIDMPMLRPLQSDRFRRKGAAALLGGPALGIADSSLSIISALANNEMNETDARRAVRMLVPFSGSWFLRQPVDNAIKSMNLPINREKARKLKEAE